MEKVFFTRKAANIDELKRRTGQEQDKSYFVIEKIIEIPQNVYDNFSYLLLADWDFVLENCSSMYLDNNGVWHCLLIKAEGANDGILVESEGYSYARYAAYWSNEERERKQANIYLAKFTLYEGEHEHRAAFLIQASSHDEAFEIAKSQEHEPTIPDDDEATTYWDYGDGTTAAELNEVIEITQETAAALEELGLAHYFNREDEGI